jgi:hypothetical protein
MREKLSLFMHADVSMEGIPPEKAQNFFIRKHCFLIQKEKVFTLIERYLFLFERHQRGADAEILEKYKEILLWKIGNQNKGSLLGRSPRCVRQNLAFIEQCVASCKASFKYSLCLANRPLIVKVVEDDPSVLSVVPVSFFRDYHFNAQMIEINPLAFKYFPEFARKDRDLAALFTRKAPHLVELLDDLFKQDMIFMRDFCMQHSHNFRYAVWLHRDLPFIKSLLTTNSDILELLDPLLVAIYSAKKLEPSLLETLTVDSFLKTYCADYGKLSLPFIERLKVLLHECSEGKTESQKERILESFYHTVLFLMVEEFFKEEDIDILIYVKAIIVIDSYEVRECLMACLLSKEYLFWKEEAERLVKFQMVSNQLEVCVYIVTSPFKEYKSLYAAMHDLVQKNPSESLEELFKSYCQMQQMVLDWQASGSVEPPLLLKYRELVAGRPSPEEFCKKWKLFHATYYLKGKSAIVKLASMSLEVMTEGLVAMAGGLFNKAEFQTPFAASSMKGIERTLLSWRNYCEVFHFAATLKQEIDRDAKSYVLFTSFIFHSVHRDITVWKEKNHVDQLHLKELALKNRSLLNKWSDRIPTILLPCGELEGEITHNPVDLLLAFEEVKDQGTLICSSYNEIAMRLPLMVNGDVKLLVIRSRRTGKIEARATLHILRNSKQEYVLFMGRVHANNHNEERENVLRQLARQKAASMGILLYEAGKQEVDEDVLIFQGGRAPFIYVEPLEKVVAGNVGFKIRCFKQITV